MCWKLNDTLRLLNKTTPVSVLRDRSDFHSVDGLFFVLLKKVYSGLEQEKIEVEKAVLSPVLPTSAKEVRSCVESWVNAYVYSVAYNVQVSSLGTMLRVFESLTQPLAESDEVFRKLRLDKFVALRLSPADVTVDELGAYVQYVREQVDTWDVSRERVVKAKVATHDSQPSKDFACHLCDGKSSKSVFSSQQELAKHIGSAHQRQCFGFGTSKNKGKGTQELCTKFGQPECTEGHMCQRARSHPMLWVPDLCFNCGSKDHWLPACPHPKPPWPPAGMGKGGKKGTGGKANGQGKGPQAKLAERTPEEQEIIAHLVESQDKLVAYREAQAAQKSSEMQKN